jgi:hypothetical protein
MSMARVIGLGVDGRAHAAPAWCPSLRRMGIPGSIGMLVGLWWDARHLGTAWLVAWCGGADPWTWQSLRLHWQVLPAMHTCMVLGGLGALALRGAGQATLAGLGCNLFCSATMLLGMDVCMSMSRTATLAGWQALPAMVAGMAAGMLAGVWALRTAHALCCACLACRQRLPMRIEVGMRHKGTR